MGVILAIVIVVASPDLATRAGVEITGVEGTALPVRAVTH